MEGLQQAVLNGPQSTFCVTDDGVSDQIDILQVLSLWILSNSAENLKQQFPMMCHTIDTHFLLLHYTCVVTVDIHTEVNLWNLGDDHNKATTITAPLVYFHEYECLTCSKKPWQLGNFKTNTATIQLLCSNRNSKHMPQETVKGHRWSFIVSCFSVVACRLPKQTILQQLSEIIYHDCLHCRCYLLKSCWCKELVLRYRSHVR